MPRPRFAHSQVAAFIVALVWVATAPKSAIAASPRNDAFAAAAPAHRLPYRGPSTTRDATLEPGESPASCEDREFPGLRSIWWRYRSREADHLLAHLGGDGADSFAVYRGHALDRLAEIGCGPIGREVLNFDTRAGETIYIRAVAAIGGRVVLHLHHQHRPVNDESAQAAVIWTLPFAGRSDTTSATRQAGEPTPSCYPSVHKSVWWTYHARRSGHLMAFLGSTGNTLAVYRGERLEDLTEIGCIDFHGLHLNFDVDRGDAIWFQVSVADGYGNGGADVLHVRRQLRPPNDNFAHATAVSYLPYRGGSNTRSASSQPREPAASCAPDASNSVWWRYTSTKADRFRVSLISWDSLAVFRGSRLRDLHELACVQAGRFSIGRLVINVTSGERIYLRVASVSTQGHPVGISVRRTSAQSTGPTNPKPSSDCPGHHPCLTTAGRPTAGPD